VPVNTRLLIDSIVRQTTVLLAELATSGGLRAPLANVADRVFLELARELDAHGVSRSVSADMFGLALRTYLRRIRRYDESATRKGASLWEAVLGFVEARKVVSRTDILDEFARDDEALVRSVLQDLTDSGLIFRSGVLATAMYRVAAPEDVNALRRGADDDGLDNALWAIIRREGPLSLPELSDRTSLHGAGLAAPLSRLVAASRIEEAKDENTVPSYSARSIFVPVGARSGWEAAVYDHFHAVVKTIVCKLRTDSDRRGLADRNGGSSYGFEVWDGHPLAEKVYGALARHRKETSELRQQVDEFNEKNTRPRRFDKVTMYFGQCVIEENDENDSHQSS
jgi:hypothetical protein